MAPTGRSPPPAPRGPPPPMGAAVLGREQEASGSAAAQSCKPQIRVVKATWQAGLEARRPVKASGTPSARPGVRAFCRWLPETKPRQAPGGARVGLCSPFGGRLSPWGSECQPPGGAATGGESRRTAAAPRAVTPDRVTRAATRQVASFPARLGRIFPFSRLGGVRRESGEEKWQGPRYLPTNGEIRSSVLGREQCWVQRSEGRWSSPPPRGQAGPCSGQRGKLKGGFAFAKTQGGVDFIFESRATWASQL